MRIRIFTFALLAAASLVACKDDNSKKGDMSVPPDASPPPVDLTASKDLTVTKDLTIPDDLVGADLSADLSGDLSVLDGATPADLTAQTDLTAPLQCGTNPTANVLQMTQTDVASATGSQVYKLPLGFTVNGTMTLTGGTAVSTSAAPSILIMFTNLFTGDVYETKTGTDVSAGGDLIFSYSIVLPYGTYGVTSTFAFVDYKPYDDGQLTVYKAEAAPFVLCPTDSVTPTPFNITHAALPTLQPRTVDITGLAAAYKTKMIDPDPAGSPTILAGLYLESTDGRLRFFKDADGYTDNSTEDDVHISNWLLPNVTGGFEMKPSFAALLIDSATGNGWNHTFRFGTTSTITFMTPSDQPAFGNLSIAASDLVTFSGSATDANGHLFKKWNGFDPDAGDELYIEHNANAKQVVPFGDLYIRPENVGDFFTDNLSYSMPVQKGGTFEFFGGLRVRVPLSTNAGSPPAKPAHYGTGGVPDLSGNDVLVLLTPTSDVSSSANATQIYTVPDLTGDVQRTITIQDAAGNPLSGVTVDAEATSLTDFTSFGARTDELATDSNGQVHLNLLKGSYRLNINANK